jgi:hypothetical protein
MTAIEQSAENPSPAARRAAESQSMDDSLRSYCLRLEARIARQSAEIEALRQMLRSLHERDDSPLR